MSYNIILNNFNEDDFISKGAKLNLKKFIKKNLTFENLGNFNQFEKEIIERYLKFNDNQVFKIHSKLKENDFNLNLIKKTLEEFKNDEKRKIIQNKINEMKKPSITPREANKLNKKRIKELKEDDRISNSMIAMYFRAKNIVDKCPKPKDVLDNKAKYIDEIFKHLLFLCDKCENRNELYQFMDNDYINYLQKLCEINYVKYLDTFFKKIYDQTSKDSKIPNLIKIEYEKNNKIEVDDKIKDKMVDSDEE